MSTLQDPVGDAPAKDEYSKAKPSKFTFKSKSQRPAKRSSREDDHDDYGDHDDDDDTGKSSQSPNRPRTGKEREREKEKQKQTEKEKPRHRHKRKHPRSHHDRHPTSTLDGTYYDSSHRHRESLYDDLETTGDPDAAFRESLFDALADDEGAAYWEGVYGQPVHVYPTTKPGADGTLERMTEEEYADYVRTKMWEKSHQHIVEEREARERARREKKRQRSRMHDDVEREEEEREHIRQRMAESLRRGEERKRAKEAEAAWEKYTQRWDELRNLSHVAEEKASDVIPWPVVSGKVRHVSKEEVERFLRGSKLWRDEPSAVLKTERVRWHPDKMQQRFGGHVDAETIKTVTAVFQIIDRMWNERR